MEVFGQACAKQLKKSTSYTKSSTNNSILNGLAHLHTRPT